MKQIHCGWWWTTGNLQPWRVVKWIIKNYSVRYPAKKISDLSGNAEKNNERKKQKKPREKKKDEKNKTSSQKPLRTKKRFCYKRGITKHERNYGSIQNHTVYRGKAGVHHHTVHDLIYREFQNLQWPDQKLYACHRDNPDHRLKCIIFYEMRSEISFQKLQCRD